MRKTSKGFTLIEMMVVMSIISLLSSVVLSAVNSARTKTDTTQRSSIVEEYRKALLLGYDKYGGYPYAGSLVNSCLGSPSSGTCGGNGGLSVNPTINGVAGEFLSSLPVHKTVVAGSTSYDGPTYWCGQPNGAADNRGGCSQVSVNWYVPGTVGVVPTKGCEPGRVSSILIGGGTWTTFCLLVLD